MRTWLGVTAGVAVGIALWGGTVLGQTKTSNCPKTPENLAGQVVKVDLDHGTVTLREADGTVHELQAPKETLQGYKVGDRIEAKLRSAPECK